MVHMLRVSNRDPDFSHEQDFIWKYHSELGEFHCWKDETTRLSLHQSVAGKIVFVLKSRTKYYT